MLVRDHPVVRSAPWTHVLFDFFGTLVSYSPSRTEQGYNRSHGLLQRFGAELTYERFLATWDRRFADYDRRSDVDDREFAMGDLVGLRTCAGSDTSCT